MAAFDALSPHIGIGPQTTRARTMTAFGLDPLRRLRGSGGASAAGASAAPTSASSTAPAFVSSPPAGLGADESSGAGDGLRLLPKSKPRSRFIVIWVSCRANTSQKCVRMIRSTRLASAGDNVF